MTQSDWAFLIGMQVSICMVGLWIHEGLNKINDTLKYISARLEDIDNGIRK